jgi:hypothetical protein
MDDTKTNIWIFYPKSGINTGVVWERKKMRISSNPRNKVAFYDGFLEFCYNP